MNNSLKKKMNKFFEWIIPINIDWMLNWMFFFSIIQCLIEFLYLLSKAFPKPAKKNQTTPKIVFFDPNLKDLGKVSQKACLVLGAALNFKWIFFEWDKLWMNKFVEWIVWLDFELIEFWMNILS